MQVVLKYIFSCLLAVGMIFPIQGESSPDGTLDSLLLLVESSDSPQLKIDYLNEVANQLLSNGGLGNLDSSRHYLQLATNLASKELDTMRLAQSSYILGKSHMSSPFNPAAATRAFLESLNLFESIHDSLGISNCHMQLGIISYVLQYHEDAIKKFKISLEYYYSPTTTYLTAIAYSEIDSLDKSKKYFAQVIKDAIREKNQRQLNECYMYLGRLYTRQGKLDSAFYLLNTVITNKRSDPDRSSLTRPYAFVAEAFLESNQLDSAIKYASISYKESRHSNSQSYDDISYLSSTKTLASAYHLKGNYRLAHGYLLESVEFEKNYSQGSMKQKVADMQSLFEFRRTLDEQQHQREKERDQAKNELERQKLLRNSFISGSILLLILSLVLYSRYNIKRRSNQALTEKNKIISDEKKRSDKLLLNILPSEIAEELKAKGWTDAKQIDHVTVLFTDFKDFTKLTEQLSPKELVQDIHLAFSQFDRIIGKYGVEKIKTIGDAYMAAGGVPIPNQSHAQDVVNAAIEIRDFIAENKKRKMRQGLPFFEIRIGVHTGPVVAGIVGVKKFSYDIWGDTVNTAARIESSGQVGQVNISQVTYDLLKDNPEYSFESRGKIEAKGKGELEMWFVTKS